MRLTEFLVVIIAALMFLIPTMKKEERSFEREAQEAEQMDLVLNRANTYKIVFEAQNPRDDAIADIKWMKKAAETARNSGIPYFNVLEHKISRRFVKKLGKSLTTIEGVIELDNDPMRAEYDAQEIEALVLTDQP